MDADAWLLSKKKQNEGVFSGTAYVYALSAVLLSQVAGSVTESRVASDYNPEHSEERCLCIRTACKLITSFWG